jgi:hypothetical protein
MKENRLSRKIRFLSGNSESNEFSRRVPDPAAIAVPLLIVLIAALFTGTGGPETEDPLRGH